jgi:hypothetical protein
VRPIIYYRGIEFERDELASAQNYFACINRLPQIQKDDLCISRYSLWPFYADQQKDIEYLGAKLISTYEQHIYIADLGNYVIDLEDITPRTWSSPLDIPDNTQFVVKGETNSRKSNWIHDMYAPNKAAAIDICNRLSNDSLIGTQKIYIREYVPLVKLLDGINGMPVAKEYRFFIAYGKVLCGGFYWQNYIADITEPLDYHEVPTEFLNKVTSRVGNKSNFYVVDVALTQSGEWIVIELNDGQFSGLSAIEPNDLYGELKRVLESEQCL